MSVTNRSIDVLKEYRNWLWLTDKDGKIINEPDHSFSHSMDAITYAVQSLKPQEEKLPKGFNDFSNWNL